ncbi:MAG TPA: hypothetical protein VHM67_07300 [Gemmatimonadaceae bacterium]|nr:hypothetical protein [Gemmatimonadaceae bacterium]
MIRLTAALALVALAGTAGAQGIPALGAAKNAATNAVNKSNASIAEQTGQPVATKTAAPANAPATQQTRPAAAKPAAGKSAAGAAVTRDTAKKARGAEAEIAFSREVFSYDDAGRRDPFLSLLATGELRPAFTDLKLVAVAYDPTGRKSVAIMRDVSTKDQYRVKVGQSIGRMRVAQIRPKSVTFTIDEFGYSRQEILALGDSSNTRTP